MRLRVTILFCAVICLPLLVKAQSVPIPNYSFETPLIDPANPFGAINQAGPWTIIGHDPTPAAPQDQGAGVFANRTGTGYIDNADPVVAYPGDPNASPNQLAFLGSLTGNEFSQVLSGLGTTYTQGQKYGLTVALARSVFAPPTVGDALTIELFYLDNTSTRQLVTSASVTYNGTNLSPTHLTDFLAPEITVGAGDPWLNKPIGVAIVANGDGNGFFDLDNVRITPEPASGMGLVLVAAAGMLRRRRASAPGKQH